MGSKWFWGSLLSIVAVILLAAILYVRSIGPGTKLRRPVSTATTVPAEAKEPMLLSLSTPKDDTLNTSGTARIAGTTIPDAVVAIIGGAEEVIIEADRNGTFATEVPLRPGLNTVTVTAFRDDGAEASETQHIVYDEG